MIKTLIVHHNDADGRCAAAIVIKARQKPLGNTACIEADYKDIRNAAWTENLLAFSRAAEEVWIVDFSFPPDLMEAIQFQKVFGGVVWIDHHKTASGYPYSHLPGLRDFSNKGPAACELAWKFLFPRMAVPRLVTLVGDYDSWRLEHPESSAVRVALEAKAWARDPKSDGWRAWLQDDDGAAALVADGYTMMEFRDGYCASMAKSYGFETRFEGLRCYAMNIYGMGSQVFGAKMKQYDACLSFVFDGKLFTVGLYSEREEVDCGAICKKHGGGGHKGAAGFQCDLLPFGLESAAQPVGAEAEGPPQA